MNPYKVSLVTGGFDPIHGGHIAMINAAQELVEGRTKVWIAVNSDEWLLRKKGYVFLPLEERINILKNIKGVEEVITWDDSDDSASGAILKTLNLSGARYVIFCNGGDRLSIEDLPRAESAWETHPNVLFEFGVGGNEKINSSSELLKRFNPQKIVKKPWGHYKVLIDGQEIKVKELVVEPGQRLSMQRHQHRNEHWFVTEGTATVYSLNVSTDLELLGVFNTFQSLDILSNEWHQLSNETDSLLKVIEVQHGDNCVEEDIERKKIKIFDDVYRTGTCWA